MPTYEYRCPSCKHQFELFQRMSDEPVADCPECGAAAVRSISGGAGLLFKGSGFYITDYRSDSYKEAASSDKESKSGKSSDSSTSKESGKQSSKEAAPAKKETRKSSDKKAD